MAYSVFFFLFISFTILPGIATKEPEFYCIPSIKVSRNTVWKAPESTTLMINCTVKIEPHCWKNLSASWCRIYDSNVCRPLTNSTYTETIWGNISGDQRVLFLMFRNLSMQDTGLYRCQTHTTVSTPSHSINVTVTEYNTDSEAINKENKTTNGPLVQSSDTTWLLPYVYLCSGTVLLVITVMVVVLLMIRCRGSKQSRKERIAENQFTPIHGTILPGKTHSLPLSPSSDCIYKNAPDRASSHRDRSSREHPANHTAKPGQRHVHCEEVEDEDSSLVYVSLNHKPMSCPPVRVTLQEESSVYSAIRVS